MTALAIIPARGGSKRIERKNLATLGDSRLIDFTIDASIKCNVFDHIVLTTDDPDIYNWTCGNIYASVSEKFITWMRDPLLGADNTKTVDVIADVLSNLDKMEEPTFIEYDYICLLEPTTPFRTALNIIQAMRMAEDNSCGVISVCRCKHPPQWNMYVREDGGLSPALHMDALRRGDVRTQDQAPIYRPNGAIYIVPWKTFMDEKSLFEGKLLSYEMSEVYSVDIDEQLDLDYARWLLKTNRVIL